MIQSESDPIPKPETAVPAPFAVIDIGSSAIRMVIAEVDTHGVIRQLDSLHREVALGKDTFVDGSISRNAIEESVGVLKTFRRVLQEYRITQDAHIRAVATNAVREAANRDAFVDRVFSATGITVEVIEEAEVSRYTYMCVQAAIDSDPALSDANLLVIEVSSGSTEVLFLQKRKLVYARPYRLGSFRLRETLEKQGAVDTHLLDVMKSQIKRTVDQISKNFHAREQIRMLVLGGDIRFAASHLLPDWNKETIGKLPVASLAHFTHKILKMPADELVRQYHLDYTDAETLCPALLTYATLAADLRMKYVYCAANTMREGVVREMAAGGALPVELQDQIMYSAIEIGRKYGFDQAHAQHVSFLSSTLFEALQAEHRLPSRFGLIIRIAAILHDIGLFVSNRSHHKHSMYLILNSDLFGLGPRDLLIVALVARYHRRAHPSPEHPEFNSLDRESRIVVATLASIIRIADALDRNYKQRVLSFAIAVGEKEVVLSVHNVVDLTVETLAIREKGELFGQVFGKDFVVQPAMAQEVSDAQS
jgi:exopolyphosphatase/guanosine-5'-triphosphate,3'-diphosphate pyrophosphatase